MELLERPEGETDATVDYPLVETPRSDGQEGWPEETSVETCPCCAGTPINGQGVLDCPDCTWTN